MNKIIITIILIFICFIIPYSQTTEKKTNLSEIGKNKYQIELGFRSVQNIYNNTASATIMFKKKLKSEELNDNTNITFLRTYFTINTDFRLNNDTFPKRRYALETPSLTDLTFGMGIEKQFQNTRFVQYIGSDIFANYNNSGRIQGYNYSSYTDFENSSFSIHYQNIKRFESGIIPFIGIKYYVTDQLNFGIETGFALSYYYSKFKDLNYKYEILNGVETKDQMSLPPYVENGIKLNFLGIRFITLGYSFK